MNIQHFYLSLFHSHTLMLFIIQSSLLRRHFWQFSVRILASCSYSAPRFPGTNRSSKNPRVVSFIRVSYPREISTMDRDEKRNLFEEVLCDSTKGGLPVFQSWRKRKVTKRSFTASRCKRRGVREENSVNTTAIKNYYPWIAHNLHITSKKKIMESNSMARRIFYQNFHIHFFPSQLNSSRIVWSK